MTATPAGQDLERAPEARSDWMYSVGRQPWFRQYHSDPRFVKLLESLRAA